MGRKRGKTIIRITITRVPHRYTYIIQTVIGGLYVIVIAVVSDQLYDYFIEVYNNKCITDAAAAAVVSVGTLIFIKYLNIGYTPNNCYYTLRLISPPH